LNLRVEAEASRFIRIDHVTPLLRPSDLRERAPAGHLAHFIFDAVGQRDLRAAGH
jgi:hypothetical protein